MSKIYEKIKFIMCSYRFPCLVEVQPLPTDVDIEEGPGRERLSVIPAHDSVVPSARYQLVVGPRVECAREYP